MTTPLLTLSQAIDALDSHDRGFNFVSESTKTTSASEPTKRLSYVELRQVIRARAGALIGRGVKPGDRVALILPDPEDFVVSFLSSVYMGAVPVPMFPPLSLGRLETYTASLTAIMSEAKVRFALTSKELSPVIWAASNAVATLKEVMVASALGSATPVNAHPATLDDLVFLQFTSGSTAHPKGVRVLHRSLAANTIGMRQALALTTADRAVSWLPLYHDMGLIGFVLTPIYMQLAVTFIPTMRFLRRPTLWLDVMSQTRATATFAPNFAYSLLAKRAAAEKDVGKWDLSSLRLCGCGAEPVSADSLTRFTTALAGAKLRPTVMTPCYGMAEATLCMSAARLDQPLTVDSIDANTFRSGGRAVSQSGTAALTFVANGPAIPGHELRIVDESGRVLPERQVGEILFGGPSLGDGYEGRPEQTAAVFSHGFIHTGDLGYLAGGEIYITGRKKDLIIIRGRNYHPHAIEWAIEKVDGVRAGNVVAFSVPGEDSEELVIVCERRSAEEGDLAGAISRLVVEQFGLTPKQVLTFAAGTLPKTSSGKQQRQKTRALYLDGSLGRGGHRAASPTRDYLGLGAIWIRSLKARAKHKLSRRFQ